MALFSFSLCFSLCPQIVRRQDAFLIASDGKGEGGSTCTCCRCQFSNWTFVINFNGSAAQFSSVQSSPAHFSQCSPGVHRAGQDFHSDPSLRFTCSASLWFSALLCCCSCSFVIYVSSLAFSWLPSMLVYCCWRGFCCCYCCLWQGRICCYCCCYCYLPIDCTLQRTAHSTEYKAP